MSTEVKTELPEDAEHSRLFIHSLARGIQLLGAFHSGHAALSLSELTTATGFTKSATQRFVYTFVATGHLRRDARGKRYCLTPRALELGFNYLQSNSLAVLGQPYLHNLNNVCGETCSITELDKLDMVVLSRFHAKAELVVQTPIGFRIPIYCSASGRAVLSYMPIEKAKNLLSHSVLTQHTSSTIVDIDMILARLIEARQDGYAYADGEFYNGDINIAATIFDAFDQPVGAVNVSAPTSRWSLNDARGKLAPYIMEAARAISGKVRFA